MTTTPRNDSIPTREQAAALLAQADDARREAAHFSPTMLVYSVICTTSGLGILLISYTEGQYRLAGIIAFLAYVLVGAFLPLVLREKSAYRGFGKRWGVLMGVWALLWGLAVALTTVVGEGTNENLQIVVPVLFSVAFLVLMVLAVAAEATRVQNARRELATTPAGA